MSETPEGYLERLEMDEPVPASAPPPSLDAVADQLARHYGHVVILVSEKDAERDESILRYAWRGGYYAARGMVHRMLDIMRAEGQDKEDEA